MSYALDYRRSQTAAYAAASDRAAFIRRTYAHLAGAVLAFTMIEVAIFKLLPEAVLNQTLGLFRSPVGMIALLIGFIAIGWVARSWAHQGGSQGIQYLGLALYVLFEALIFVPILYVVTRILPPEQGEHILQEAVIMTLSLFGGLTAAVLITRKDFSFLGNILSIGCFLMLGFAIAALIFGFNVGLLYCFLGVALACGFILYDTSNVLHHFRTDQHVAASLELFASIALLFYYILRILIATRND